MNRIHFSICHFLLSLLLLVSACTGDSNSDTAPTFDRQAMLDHYAKNMIRPAYTDLQTAVNALQNSADAFVSAPDVAKLQATQTAWASAYKMWQAANAFNFGPGGEEGVRKGLIEEIGTFPAAEGKIEAAITANDHSLNNFDRDARGFLALEYLLFGKNKTSSELVSDFQNSTARQAHLQAIVNNLKTRVDAVVSGWDTYESDFVKNKGTDVGSSTSQLYNEFVRSFESIKNFKVGLPAGKRPGQTKSEPQLVEAFYSGQSLEMMKLHFQAIEHLYYGRTKNGTSGLSFKDYLESVEGGKALVALTEAQIKVIKEAFAKIPTDQPFSVLVANNDPTVDVLHTELQKHTRFFKSDMSSLLGIAITFSSGDGD